MEKSISDSDILELVNLAYEDICKNWNLQMHFLSVHPPIFGHIQGFTEKFLQGTEAVDPDDLLGKCPYEAGRHGLLNRQLLRTIRESDKQVMKNLLLQEASLAGNKTLNITDEELNMYLDAYRGVRSSEMAEYYKHTGN